MYENIEFTPVEGRPMFYTNMVQTLDGKTWVTNPDPANLNPYWPIGSLADYAALTDLRGKADALIHGSNTALIFGVKTLERLNDPDFKTMRSKADKNPDLPYYVATTNPKKFDIFDNSPTKPSFAPPNLERLSRRLYEKGYRHVLVEGGPTLLRSFLEEGLLDEVFVTIAPRIFGDNNNNTLTMVEGGLFLPKQIELQLLSCVPQGNEAFLRFSVIHEQPVEPK